MHSRCVLLIGDKRDSRLVDAFFEVGLTAVVKRPSVGTFAEVRQRAYEALVIDDANPDRDVLEAVLNLRDYDERVPIVVLGANGHRMGDELLRRLQVHWHDRSVSSHTIVSTVQKLLRAQRDRTGRGDPRNRGRD